MSGERLGTSSYTACIDSVLSKDGEAGPQNGQYGIGAVIRD